MKYYFDQCKKVGYNLNDIQIKFFNYKEEKFSNYLSIKTNESRNQIIEYLELFKDDNIVLNCKGDYMKQCKILDTRIKEIDSAIPLHVSKSLHDFNISTNNLCMIYFKNGTCEIINIVEHYTILKANK